MTPAAAPSMAVLFDPSLFESSRSGTASRGWCEPIPPHESTLPLPSVEGLAERVCFPLKAIDQI